MIAVERGGPTVSSRTVISRTGPVRDPKVT